MTAIQCTKLFSPPISVLALCLLGLVTVSCSHSAKQLPMKSESHPHHSALTKTQIQQLAKRWRVVGFANYSQQKLAQHSAHIDLTPLPQATLYAGCNQIMFQLDVSGNHLSVGELMSTRMACMDNVLEQDLSAALKRVTQYRWQGKYLVLLTDSQQRILLSQ